MKTGNWIMPLMLAVVVLLTAQAWTVPKPKPVTKPAPKPAVKFTQMNGPIIGKAGKYTVTVAYHPAPPVTGGNAISVRVTDEKKPLIGAMVKAELVGPRNAKPIVLQLTPPPPGKSNLYCGAASFAQAGLWKVTVKVAEKVGKVMPDDGEVTFALTVKAARPAVKTPVKPAPAPKPAVKPTPPGNPKPAFKPPAIPVIGKAGKYTVQLKMNPAVPVKGNNSFYIYIPQSPGEVAIHLGMVGSKSMSSDVKAEEGQAIGVYYANVNFSKAGQWKVTVKAAQMAGKKTWGDGEVSFTVNVKAPAPSAKP